MSHKGFVILQIAEEGPAKEATPQVVEESPVPEQPVGTAARPRRAAAAAAQRAIAATAVKRQRGKRLSGASLASLPGDDQMLLVAVANQRKIVCIVFAAALAAFCHQLSCMQVLPKIQDFMLKVGHALIRDSAAH